MNYIHPLANALGQSIVTQQEMSAEKARRARETRTPSRTPQADQFEHQIESPEEAAAIHEEARQKRQQRGRRQRHLRDETSDEGKEPAHIDLKA
jgi:hypothetical protein